MSASVSPRARECFEKFRVLYRPLLKRGRSFLFIWEGSESPKPSCRSVCCCLGSLHLNMFGIFVHLSSDSEWEFFLTSKEKWRLLRPHWWRISALICQMLSVWSACGCFVWEKVAEWKGHKRQTRSPHNVWPFVFWPWLMNCFQIFGKSENLLPCEKLHNISHSIFLPFYITKLEDYFFVILRC